MAFWLNWTNDGSPTHTPAKVSDAYKHFSPLHTNERWLNAQTVAPEVRAAVRDGAVAEQVTVADGIQVGHRAQVISTRAAPSSPLAVRAMWVPDAAHMKWTGKFSLGSSGQDSVRSTLLHHQEQHHNSQKDETHD